MAFLCSPPFQYLLYYPRVPDVDRCWSAKGPAPSDDALIAKEGLWSQQEVEQWKISLGTSYYAVDCANAFMPPDILAPYFPDDPCDPDRTTPQPGEDKLE